MKPEGKRVLITGAGGFVGRSLALGFDDLGWCVIGLDRAFDAGRELHGIQAVTADLAEGVPVDVPEVDLVVHAAWVTTEPAALGITPLEYVDLNLRPLEQALAFATRTEAASFVFLSSSGVFAPTDATEGLTDTDRPSGTSPYAVAKRAGEALVATAPGEEAARSPDRGTAVHVARLGYLFGPAEVARPSRQGVSLVAGWLAAARNGHPCEVRSDDPVREWTFTPDLAAALERVANAPPAGRPLHLGSPHVCRDRELASLIASEARGVGVVTVPAVGRVKPPMIPSDIPALRGFGWTEPHVGLRALLAEEVAA